MKQYSISPKTYATMDWPKLQLNITSRFNDRKIYPLLRITLKIQKEKLYSLIHHIALMFQQISVKNS